jgi:hypothetical protein
MLSENNAVVFKVAGTASKPRSRRGGSAVQRQGDGRQHDRHQGQDQEVEGHALQASDVKKAIVTLAEGPVDRHHERDLSVMALKAYKPTSPARRGLILVDKSSLWKGKPVKA